MKLLPPLLALVLSGCVTVPIPPFGDEQQRGSLGALRVSVSVQYLPKTTNQTTDAGLDHAQRQFQQSLRTLKDK